MLYRRLCICGANQIAQAGLCVNSKDCQYLIYMSLVQIANELNEKLRQVDETVSCSSSYLSKVTLQDRQSRWGEPGTPQNLACSEGFL